MNAAAASGSNFTPTLCIYRSLQQRHTESATPAAHQAQRHTAHACDGNRLKVNIQTTVTKYISITHQITLTMDQARSLSFTNEADQKLKLGKVIKGAVNVVKKAAPIAQVVFPQSAVIGKVAAVAGKL